MTLYIGSAHALDRVARGATVLDPQVVAQRLAVQRRHDPLKI
jgi:hypothetical protein